MRSVRDAYRGFVQRDFVWYAVDEDTAGADIVYLYHSLAPVAAPYTEVTKTIMIDLTRPADDLFAEVQKDARYKIKRAEREGVTFVALAPPSDADMAEFNVAHADLEARVNRPKIDFAKQKLLATRQREFVLTKSLDADGKPVSWHLYLSFQGRARLVHTVTILLDKNSTQDKNFAGRANRFHHWKDILYFKERGLTLFDFGGWVAPGEDAKMRSISEFKEGFGGKVVECHNAVIPKTRLGAVVASIRNTFHI